MVVGWLSAPHSGVPSIARNELYNRTKPLSLIYMHKKLYLSIV